MYDLIVIILEQIGIYGILYKIFDNLLDILIYGIVSIILIAISSVCVLIITYMERKELADFQIRLGPMETGGRRFHGILQPVADGIKLFLKEDIIPERVDKILFILAPIITFSSTFLMLAVIPFDKSIIPVDLGMGILFISAISTICPLGVMMAGWASESKYALLSSLRAAAQMITYEIPITLSLLSVVLISGTLNLNEIVLQQNGTIMGIIPKWNIFLLPISFIIFFIASLAELGRTPFDLLEAESEIVSGYNIEYSGMRFAFFYLAEYLHLFIASAIATVLFLGGWNGILLPGIIWFFIKTFMIIYLIIWIRATLPRVRIDQLMTLGWKVLIPLSLINIGIIGMVITL